MKKIVLQKIMQKSLIRAKFDTMQNKLHSLANKVEPQNKDLKQLNKSKTLKNSQNKKMLILKDKNCLN